MTPYRKAFHLCPTKYCRNRKAPKRLNCSKCAMRAWRATNPVKALLAHLRDHAAENGVPFKIRLNWFENFLVSFRYDRTIHHIDRIKTWLGYVEGNLQVLVAAENIAKGNRERYADRRWAEQPF